MGDHDEKKRDRKEDRERRHHHEREMEEPYVADDELPDEVTEAEACEQDDEDGKRDKKKDKKKDKKACKEPKVEYAGHPEFAAKLTEMVRAKGGDGYSLAFEMTKLYISTGGADAKRVPGLFASLFEMFEFGVYPSSSKK